MNNILEIGNSNLFYNLEFKDEYSTQKYVIKGSKYEILKFFIDNYNIYNLKNKYSLNNDINVDVILNEIKNKNKNKIFSHSFYFADGKYNYINHHFEKINIFDCNNNINKKKCCTIV